MTADELKAICDLTVALTKLQQGELSDLRVDDFAPEIFQKLRRAFEAGGVQHLGQIRVDVPSFADPVQRSYDDCKDWNCSIHYEDECNRYGRTVRVKKPPKPGSK